MRRWEHGEDVPLVQLDAGSLLGDVPLADGAQKRWLGDISPVDLDPQLAP